MRPRARGVGGSATRSVRARCIHGGNPSGRGRRRGMRAFNVQPGFITTERMARTWPRSVRRLDRRAGRSVAKVCRWLLESPDADRATARTSRPSRCAASSACSPGGRSRRAEHGRVGQPGRCWSARPPVPSGRGGAGRDERGTRTWITRFVVAGPTIIGLVVAASLWTKPWTSVGDWAAISYAPTMYSRGTRHSLASTPHTIGTIPVRASFGSSGR